MQPTNSCLNFFGRSSDLRVTFRTLSEFGAFIVFLAATHCQKHAICRSSLESNSASSRMDINAALMRRAMLPIAAKRKRTPTKTTSRNESPAARAAPSSSSKLTMSPFAKPCTADARSSPVRKKQRALPSASAAPSPSSATPVKATPTLQSYIDVGQKSFGKYTTCRTCGLLYTVGEEVQSKQSCL